MKAGDKFTAYLVHESEREEAGRDLEYVVEVECLGTVEEFSERYGEDVATDAGVMTEGATHVFAVRAEDAEAYSIFGAEPLPDGRCVRGWSQLSPERPDAWVEAAYGGYYAVMILVPKNKTTQVTSGRGIVVACFPPDHVLIDFTTVWSTHPLAGFSTRRMWAKTEFKVGRLFLKFESPGAVGAVGKWAEGEVDPALDVDGITIETTLSPLVVTGEFEWRVVE